ncbi:MAG: AAA family ATPase, partial [Planctomycetaceae bacterium]
ALAVGEGALWGAERRACEPSRTLDEAAARLAGLDAEAEALSATRGRAEATIADIDRSRGSLAGEIQRLEILVDAAGERQERAVGEAAARRRDATERRTAVDAALERVDATATRVAEAELDWLAAGAALAEACWRAERAEEALEELASRLAAARAAATVAGAAAESARHEAAALGERTHARELEAGEARHRRTRILERIRDEYDIDMEAERSTPAPGDADAAESIPADRAELEAAIEEARRKLSSMQTVNLEALAESEQLAERLAGLEAQLGDVTGAKQSIEELIARIDDESRRLLAETIETVRGHFRDLFERVFGGGQADILLEPGVDVLETAVEILARPPGKEPRSISLLSGGEKTMTCVALLLAIFRSRPSPFCILDEVDAALDEANVDRFVGVLREFPDTQIILVTHRKATMAAADTLYGVTMEEAGVSRRVSVRFEKAPAAARAAPRAAA